MENTPDWTRSDDPFNDLLMKYQVRHIQEYMRKDGHLLDVGCNDGTLLRLLQPASAVGIDPNEKAIQEARRHPVPFAVFVHGDLETVTSLSKFNTITLINVLEHVDSPVEMLSRVRELLSPDGVAIVHVPNALGFHRQLGVKMGLLDSPYQLGADDLRVGHKRFFDLVGLRAVAWQAGLRITASGCIMVKPFSNAQMQRIVDEWENADAILDGLCKLGKHFPEHGSPIWMVCQKRENKKTR